MKKPFTTAEYFRLLCNRLRAKGQMPDDILDYALAAHDPVAIRTCEFNLRSNLDYGANEGIYLDVSIEFFEDGQRECRKLGTFKTLDESAEAMRTMARLLADFIVEDRAYVNSHLDDFTWTGADVYPVKEDGVRTGWSYSCTSMEAAVKRKDKLMEKYPSVIIRDNATRREICYRCSGKSDAA
ncbi:MAG: hypothetical protein LUI87_05385 [Lachnospiraceae bacterium]|nr:hypothetical protein [Lachnospiraceae bacterium]